MKLRFKKHKKETHNSLVKGVVGGTILAATVAIYMNSHRTIPYGVKAVKPFDIKKYLGKWYEMARLDYHFEKSLDNVSAEYSLNKDGSVRVVNSGYNYKKSQKEESVGIAKFVGTTDEAKLKVSFWGPFYSGYNVIAIDKNYKYALVAGKSRKYLWVLSRETSIPEEVKKDYIEKAKSLGFKVNKLIWSDHK